MPPVPARPVLVLGLSLALTAAGLLPLASPGSAAPTPAPAATVTATRPIASSIAEVQARADALELSVDEAVEDYLQAQVELDAMRVQAGAAAADVVRQQAELARLQAGVGQVAAAAYRGGSPQGLSLLTDSTDARAYLDRVAALDGLAAQQALRLTEASTLHTRLDAAERAAQAGLSAQQAVERRAAERQAEIEADLAASQALLGSLQAEQRAQLEAARAAQQAQDAARSAEVERASRARPAQITAPAEQPSDPTPVPASGRAAVAVQAAYSKLGSPYRWGAAGPGSFDCSGFTMWSWARAGVSLPHSSRAQYSSGRKVSRDQLQPGDLVFFGSGGISHVGMYVGGGNMIAAPHTGDVVKVQPAFRSNYVGAVRPG